MLYDVVLPEVVSNDLFKMNYLFIIMEYVPNNFNELMCGTIDKSQESLVKIIYKILCCMKFVHSAGIMHRDIKPANLLISSTSEVRICDFGLSRDMPKLIRKELTKD